MQSGGWPLPTWGTEAPRRADGGAAGGDRAEGGGGASEQKTTATRGMDRCRLPPRAAALLKVA